MIGVLAGDEPGFACFKFVGCASGADPLTSQLVISTIYRDSISVILANGFR
jgi:hypothetical protein